MVWLKQSKEEFAFLKTKVLWLTNRLPWQRESTLRKDVFSLYTKEPSELNTTILKRIDPQIVIVDSHNEGMLSTLKAWHKLKENCNRPVICTFKPPVIEWIHVEWESAQDFQRTFAKAILVFMKQHIAALNSKNKLIVNDSSQYSWCYIPSPGKLTAVSGNFLKIVSEYNLAVDTIIQLSSKKFDNGREFPLQGRVLYCEQITDRQWEGYCEIQPYTDDHNNTLGNLVEFLPETSQESSLPADTKDSNSIVNNIKGFYKTVLTRTTSKKDIADNKNKYHANADNTDNTDSEIERQRMAKSLRRKERVIKQQTREIAKLEQTCEELSIANKKGLLPAKNSNLSDIKKSQEILQERQQLQVSIKKKDRIIKQQNDKIAQIKQENATLADNSGPHAVPLVNESVAESGELSAKCEQLAGSIKQKDHAIAQQSRRIIQLEQDYDQLSDDFKGRLSTLKRTNQELKNSLTDLFADEDEAEELHKLTASMAKSEQAFAACEQSIAAKRPTSERSHDGAIPAATKNTADFQRLQEKAKLLAAKVVTLENQLTLATANQKQDESKRYQAEAASNKVIILTNKLALASANSAQWKQESARLQPIAQKVTQLERELAIAQSQKDGLANTTHDKQLLNDLQSQLGAQQRINAALNKKLEKLNPKVARSRELEAANSRLENSNKEMEKSITILKNHNRRLTEQQKPAAKTETKASVVSDQQKNGLNNNEEIGRLQNEQVQLQLEVAGLKQKIVGFADLEAQKNDLYIRVQDYEKELKAKNILYNELKNDHADTQQEYNALYKQMTRKRLQAGSRNKTH